MASVYDIKPRFQAVLRPFVRVLAGANVTANQVTILAAALSVAMGTLLYLYPDRRWALLLVPGTLLVRMALNAIDGMLAREHNQKSRLGAVLNELGDVVSDAALYLPLALVPGVRASLLVVAVVLGIISEMAGVVALEVGAERRYDGPLGKSDRAFAFGLIAFLLGCGLTPGRWLDWVLAIMILMSGVTIVRRSHRALATEKTSP